MSSKKDQVRFSKLGFNGPFDQISLDLIYFILIFFGKVSKPKSSPALGLELGRGLCLRPKRLLSLGIKSGARVQAIDLKTEILVGNLKNQSLIPRNLGSKFSKSRKVFLFEKTWTWPTKFIISNPPLHSHFKNTYFFRPFFS